MSTAIGADTHTGEPSERTSNIGTRLYIAPEVAISRSYDIKVGPSKGNS